MTSKQSNKKTTVKTNDDDETDNTLPVIKVNASVKKPIKEASIVPDMSGISQEWLDILEDDTLPDIFKKLKGAITPPPDKIFEFARLTELSKVKVIIIGQDPYPRAGDAHGLAFSCLTGIPASLKNIFKCLLKHKLIDAIPSHGNLEYWAKQGVLLLNRALTTVIGQPNAHAELWGQYTTNLIQRLAANKPLIFMLWGANARALNSEEIVGKKSFVYEWTHPSPMAQSKQSFMDCDHFTEANKRLIRLGKEPIDWNVDPPGNEVELAFGAKPSTSVVFTDGSCEPNRVCPDAIGAYAASFALGNFKDTVLYGNIPNRPVFASNQRAEGYAMLKTFKFLLEHINEWEDAIIVSDSDFWIKMHEIYMPSWYRRGGFEAFAEKKNPDLTVALYTAYNELTEEHQKSVTFRHVKSHNKLGWSKFPEDSYEYFCWLNNDYVDKMAEFARVNLTPGQDEIEEASYEQDLKDAKKKPAEKKTTEKKPVDDTVDEIEIDEDQAEALESAE